MKFAIYSCFNTFELLRRAKAMGFNVWAPIVRSVEPRGYRGNRRYVEVNRLEMPGLIFVGWDKHERFHMWAAERYSVSPLTEYYDGASATNQERENYIRPQSCQLHEMMRMQERLNEEYGKDKHLIGHHENEVWPEYLFEEPEPVGNFQVGDLVYVQMGPNQVPGEITKLQAYGARARVKTLIGFANQVDVANLVRRKAAAAARELI